MSKQSEIKQNAYKKAIQFILLAIYCWACFLTSRIVCYNSEILSEKPSFPFGSGYSLETASGLGIGTCVQFFQF